MDGGWKNFDELNRKSIHFLNKTCDRNMNIKTHDEGLEGNTENVIGNWKKGNS